MRTKKVILVAAISSIIAACGSTKDESPSLATNLPDWVLNPVIEDGIAASTCIKFSGNFSVDQKMATANGRLALAQQIGVRVEGLDKTYDRRTDTNGEKSSASNFSSVSKQLTKAKLSGARSIKKEIVKIDGKDHLCVLMSLNPNATKDLFASIIQQSKLNVSSQDTKVLFKEFINDNSEDNMDEFYQWKKDYLAEYQAYRVEHFKKVDDTRDMLISLWGESEVSSQAQYVEYSHDKNTKTVVDFEKNEIRVSVLHGKNEKVNKKDIVTAIHTASNKNESNQSNALVQLLGEKPSNSNIDKLVSKANIKDKNTDITRNKTAVINKEIKIINEQENAQKSHIEQIYDQVASDEQDKKQVVLTAAEEIKIAKEIAQEQKKIEKEKTIRIAVLKNKLAELKNKNKREELTDKKITTFTIPIANKKDLTKAKPFISDVQTQSKRWDLDPSLLLSIMHTESYFNPKAQSHVPAFGLMQIVPRTAGVDVNRMLFKKDEPMSQDYLFDANRNIEAGVAYMHILNSRYLRKITNPESRMYCMISAYNTGSGNVAKTFNKDKSRNINSAAPIINGLTPKEVYNHLVNNLPYDETRHYLERVVNRMSIYAPVQKL